MCAREQSRRELRQTARKDPGGEWASGEGVPRGPNLRHSDTPGEVRPHGCAPRPDSPLAAPGQSGGLLPVYGQTGPPASPGKGPALLLMFQGPKMRPFALALKYFLAFSAALLPGGRTSLSTALSIDDLSRLL